MAGQTSSDSTGDQIKDHKVIPHDRLTGGQFWTKEEQRELPSSGKGLRQELKEGKELDMTPLFNPDGKHIPESQRGSEGFVIMPRPDKNEPAGDVLQPLDVKADPQKEADKRDAQTMMDDMRNGNLSDLKKAVGDMSPAKLKRVAEELKAEGFDMQVDKDGRFVMYNKDLKMGVAVGSDGKAEVVEKDKDGNFVKTTTERDPEAVFKQFANQMPPDKDILVIPEFKFPKGIDNDWKPLIHKHWYEPDDKFDGRRTFNDK